MPLENTALGTIKLEGQIDDLCIEDLASFIKALEKYAKIHIPYSVTNVIVGNIPPGDGDRQKVWFRTDSSGSFVGIYIYAQGSWNVIFPYPKQLFWIGPGSDSRKIEKGFELISEDSGGMTTGEAQAIVAQYIGSPGNDYYTYYAVRYKGF